MLDDIFSKLECWTKYLVEFAALHAPQCDRQMRSVTGFHLAVVSFQNKMLSDFAIIHCVNNELTGCSISCPELWSHTGCLRCTYHLKALKVPFFFFLLKSCQVSTRQMQSERGNV